MSGTIRQSGGESLGLDFGELVDTSVDIICGECCRGSYAVASGSRAVCYLCGHEIAPRDLDPDPDVRIVWGEPGTILRAVEIEIDETDDER
jgi:hypothetical protein